MARKTTQKTRIFNPNRTPKSLEKKGKTLEKTRKFLAREKKRNSKKTRKGRTGKSPQGLYNRSKDWAWKSKIVAFSSHERNRTRPTALLHAHSMLCGSKPDGGVRKRTSKKKARKVPPQMRYKLMIEKSEQPIRDSPLGETSTESLKGSFLMRRSASGYPSCAHAFHRDIAVAQQIALHFMHVRAGLFAHFFVTGLNANSWKLTGGPATKWGTKKLPSSDD